MTGTARAVRLRCTATDKCSFHRDGGPTNERCPGRCDWPSCSADAFYEVAVDRLLCAAHGAIVLLARAVHEALAADDVERRV